MITRFQCITNKLGFGFQMFRDGFHYAIQNVTFLCSQFSTKSFNLFGGVLSIVLVRFWFVSRWFFRKFLTPLIAVCRSHIPDVVSHHVVFFHDIFLLTSVFSVFFILESRSWSSEKSEVSIWSFLYNSTLLFDFLIAFLPSLSLILCTNLRCRVTLKRLLVSCEHNLHIHILMFTIQQSNKEWICLDVLMRNVHGSFNLESRRVCRIYFTLNCCIWVVRTLERWDWEKLRTHTLWNIN